MRQADDNSWLVTRYLLGEVSEDERAELEERFFEDADFLLEVRAIERDLIDCYVRGELRGEQLKRFESRFLASPELRRRVLFADALAKSLARCRGVGETVAQKPLAPAWLSDRSLNVNRWTPLLVATAMAVLVICGLLVWKREQKPPPSPAPIAEDQPQAPDAPSPPPPALPSNVSPDPAPRPQPAIVTLVLNGGRSRSHSEPNKLLAIAPYHSTVRIHLQLRSDEYASYRADLLTPDREPVWSSGPIKRRQTKGGSRLSVDIRANRFSSRSYIIVVTAENESGLAEEIDSYYFRVKKQ